MKMSELCATCKKWNQCEKGKSAIIWRCPDYVDFMEKSTKEVQSENGE